jgi:AraC family transcriptional regulator of adaptative response/methylated-DNA-[protein]-cysteine methyltransferase
MQDERWQAIATRNAGWDGQIFYGVTTTRIYCRPSCPSRRPKPENIRYFESSAEAEKAGFRACLRCHPQQTAHLPSVSITRVCRFIEQHIDAMPDLTTLARVARLSKFHFLRAFKEATGMTPRAYGSLCRTRLLKKKLRAGGSVTDAMYDVGYGSPSRLYESSTRELGMTPRQYRDGGLGKKIRYTVVHSPLGRMLVGATDRGVCAIQFGESVPELERSLKREYPFAELEYDPVPLLGWLEQLNRHLAGERPRLDLPVDIQATVFQRRVWEALQQIPYGETRTYSELAALAGNPKAVRAAASACANNKVAVLIPCHRAVRTDGGLGGYRWGLSRKVQLLATERAKATPASTPAEATPPLAATR